MGISIEIGSFIANGVSGMLYTTACLVAWIRGVDRIGGFFVFVRRYDADDFSPFLFL